MPVSLEPFDAAHLPRLGSWLRAPHVAPWYPHPADDLERAATPPPGAGHWLIATARGPVGYLRWVHVDRATLDALGLGEVPANSVDMDILLGEPDVLGRGYGPEALQLAALTFLADETVAQLGLTTSVRNTNAHRAFVKAGFGIVRQYRPPGLELCHLMIRDLAAERARSRRR